MIHVHLGHDFYGAGNIGDDFMLAGFLAAVHQSSAQVTFTCCSPHDLYSQRKRFPQVDWRDPSEKPACLANCDLWLGLGGSPFQSSVGFWLLDSICQDLRLIGRLRKPAYMLGVAVNDLESLKADQTREILDSLKMVWTRDQSSAEALQSISDAKIYVGSDLAHLYLSGIGPPPAARNPLLGVILHVESLNLLKPEAVTTGLAALDVPLLWIAQETRTLSASERFLHPIIHPAGDVPLFVPNYHEGSLQQLLEPWTRCSAFFSSRYHGALIGAWLQKPLTVFARAFKLEGLIRELGLSRCPSLTDADAIVSSVKKASVVSQKMLNLCKQRAFNACADFFRQAGLAC